VADYYAVVRSNHFLVRDAKKFESFCERCGLTTFHNEPVWPEGWCSVRAVTNGRAPRRRETTRRYGFYGTENGLPSYMRTKNDHVAIDFIPRFAKYLAVGEAAIIMESGSEKVRYICGYAWAVNWRGTVRHVSLSDIYKLTKEIAGGKTATPCEY